MYIHYIQVYVSFVFEEEEKKDIQRLLRVHNLNVFELKYEIQT